LAGSDGRSAWHEKAGNERVLVARAAEERKKAYSEENSADDEGRPSLRARRGQRLHA
jgi:hypothetical protein